jgi:hypothetical protein
VLTEESKRNGAGWELDTTQPTGGPEATDDRVRSEEYTALSERIDDVFSRADLISLTYVSHAREQFTAASLEELLRRSRDANQQNQITGFLIYRHRTFIQILEGKDAIVRDLYARIESDPRHTDIRVVLEEPIPSRRFEGWSMGHEPIVPGAPGTTRVENAIDSLESQESHEAPKALSEIGDWLEERARRVR